MEANKKHKKNARRQLRGNSKTKVGDTPKSVQQQVSQRSMEAINKSMIAMSKALAMTHLEGEGNPRVLGMMQWCIEVGDCPSSGGIIPPDRLRREKPLVWRLSTSKQDLVHVMNISTIENYKEKHEVVDFLGNSQGFFDGQEQLNSIFNFQEERKKRRTKKQACATHTGGIVSELAQSEYTATQV